MPTVEVYSQPDEPPVDKVLLPGGVFLGMPSRDLLSRLLEVQPSKRLRSLRTLGTIAFYKGYNFNDVKDKRFKAKDLLIQHYGEDYQKPKEDMASFEGFDEIFITD